MQKFMPFLKALLAGCIGLLVIIVILNLAFGNISGAGQMTMPVLFGLYAFLFIGRANFTAAKCPTCATFRQLTLGGWTCVNCGTELDRHGKAIDHKA